MLQSDQTSCSPHLAYIGSRWAEPADDWHMSPGEGVHDILKFHGVTHSRSHALPYMWKFQTNIGRLVNRSRHRTFWSQLCGRNANGTVREAPIFGGGDTKKSVGSDITHCRPLYVCKFLGSLSFARLPGRFSEISFTPVEAFNNGTPW